MLRALAPWSHGMPVWPPTSVSQSTRTWEGKAANNAVLRRRFDQWLQSMDSVHCEFVGHAGLSCLKPQAQHVLRMAADTSTLLAAQMVTSATVLICSTAPNKVSDFGVAPLSFAASTFSSFRPAWRIVSVASLYRLSALADPCRPGPPPPNCGHRRRPASASGSEG